MGGVTKTREAPSFLVAQIRPMKAQAALLPPAMVVTQTHLLAVQWRRGWQILRGQVVNISGFAGPRVSATPLPLGYCGAKAVADILK